MSSAKSRDALLLQRASLYAFIAVLLQILFFVLCVLVHVLSLQKSVYGFVGDTFGFLSEMAVGRYGGLMQAGFASLAAALFFTSATFRLEMQISQISSHCAFLFLICSINVLVILVFPLRGEISTSIHNLAVPPLLFLCALSAFSLPSRIRKALPLKALVRPVGTAFFFLIVPLCGVIGVGWGVSGVSQRLLVLLLICGHLLALLRLLLFLRDRTKELTYPLPFSNP